MYWDMRPSEEPLREFNAQQRETPITLKRDTGHSQGTRHGKSLDRSTLSATNTQADLEQITLHGYIRILLKILS